MLPAIFIPLLIFFILLSLCLTTIYLLKAFYKRKGRRTPFSDKFLRGPGQSLIEKLDDISLELDSNLLMLIMMPLLLYAIIVSSLYFWDRSLSARSLAIYILFGVVMTGYFLYKMVKLLNLRRTTRLGYEGEVATGQELNQMMHQGYHVYHDFVANGFNIDHVVVGKAGVFAVETKARSKPTSGNKKADAQVTYDGKCLQFPDRREVKPLEQAKNQAIWMGRWLSSATGEKTQVRPVVALPGWNVTRTAGDGIPVINPKQFRHILKPVDGIVLDDRRIKSISHQLDQRCRNVGAYALEGLGGRK